MRTINGQEASVLSLLAQSKSSLSKQDKIRILNFLSSDIRNIGEAILDIGSHSEEINIVAKGFIDWANSLKPNKIIG